MKSSVFRRLVFAGLISGSFGAQADVVYSSILDPLPANVPSYAYAANGIDELYDQVTLAPGGRLLQSITLTMSDWALYSTYASQGYSAAGYNQLLTVDLFGGAYPSETYLGSDTITAIVPWRPEPTANCTDANDPLTPKGYGADCNHGIAFNVTFDFSGQNIVVPDTIIFGLTFQTQNHGYDPVTGEQGGTGTDGPYDSLNLGTGTPPTIGTDDAPFASDVSAQIVTSAATVPEPSTISLFGIALVGLLGAARRSRRKG